ncbi:Proline-rich protein 2 [Linum perenne]
MHLSIPIQPQTKMQILTSSRGALVCLYSLLLLFFSATLCHGNAGNQNTAPQVVGFGECADCSKSQLHPSQIFSGLHVTIDCKPQNGEFKTRGAGELDEEGKFSVSLPSDIVSENGMKLKEECYAQLHSAAPTPCAAHGGLESSKVVFNSQKKTFELSGGKIKFSPEVCASAFFWPHFKHPSLPKLKLPPLKSFSHHFKFPPKVFPPFAPKVFPPFPPVFPPPVPIVKKPCPPIVKPPYIPKPTPEPPVVVKPPYIPKPTPKPPVVVKPPYIPKPTPKPPKVLPPPVPIYKPKPPVYHNPKVPIYKPHPKPPISLPPIPKVPIYEPHPKPPITLPPTPEVPIYKPYPKPPITLPPTPEVPIYKPYPKPPITLPPTPEVPIYKPYPKPPISIPPTPDVPIYKPLPPISKFPPFHKKPCPPLPKLPPFPKLHPKHKFGSWPPLPPFSPIH